MPLLTVKNIRVHYRIQGDSNQPTLLLIHGLGCSLQYWNCLFDAEQFSGYRLLALDLPGFGMSEKPEDYDYGLSSQAELVFEMLGGLHIRDFSLVGHSMGGSIAILMALSHPQSIRRLLVIEPNLRANDAQLSRQIVEYTESGFIEHYQDFQSSAIATVKRWFVNFQQNNLDQYVDDLLQTTPVSMYRSAYSLIATTSNVSFLRQFQQLALPKHFLIGEETLKTSSFLQEFTNGNIQTVIVPGVGHMMMVDNPVLFANTLAAILS